MQNLTIFQSSQGTTQPPTYRSFAFAESMEGTKASLSRHRRNQGPSPVPPYLPTTYDMIRKQSKGSVMLHEEGERRTVRSDSGIYVERQRVNRDGVPISPARYSEPTDSDLENTQPISKDIVSQEIASKGWERMGNLEDNYIDV